MVLNIAHRGGRSLAPENTLAAFRQGLAANADLLETDIRPTMDGELVLFHDDTLERTTDVRQRFPGRDIYSSGFTLKELQQLDAGSWFVDSDPFGQIASGALPPGTCEAFRGERIPTLEDALVFTRDAGWPVNLELKRLSCPIKTFPLVDRVLEIVKRVGISEDLICFSSFKHSWLRELMEKKPKIAVQALVGGIDETRIDWGALDFGTYNAGARLITNKMIEEVRAKNIRLNLFTVNDTSDMKRFIEAGVQGLITDFPQRLEKIKVDMSA